MKKMFIILGIVTAAAACLFGTAGCEVGTGDSGSRNVDISVWGVYRGITNRWDGKLVSRATGSAPSSMDLRQHGDSLEGVTDHGIIFRGSIGSVVSGTKTCSFTLNGKTTAGNSVILNGRIDVSGTQAIMTGTWIEDTLYGEFHGTATAPPQPEPKPTTTPITVATPRFNPDGGTYTNTTVVVTVTCDTSGATIHYTTTGIDPTTSDSTVASGGTIMVQVPRTLKARAFKDGIGSSVKSADYK